MQHIKEYLIFIDNYILNSIKKEPYYYESVEELYLWLYDEKYNKEASDLITWCLVCKNIAFKIQLGELQFVSISQLLEALPKL